MKYLQGLVLKEGLETSTVKSPERNTAPWAGFGFQGITLHSSEGPLSSGGSRGAGGDSVLILQLC